MFLINMEFTIILLISGLFVIFRRIAIMLKDHENRLSKLEK